MKNPEFWGEVGRVLFRATESSIEVVPYTQEAFQRSHTRGYFKPDPISQFVGGGEEHSIAYGISTEGCSSILIERTPNRSSLNTKEFPKMNLSRYFRTLEVIRKAHEINPENQDIMNCIFHRGTFQALDPDILFSSREDLAETYIRGFREAITALGGGQMGLDLLDEIARMPVPDLSEAIKSCEDFSIPYEASELTV